eukprot:Blabericola_migrator_1__12992@NODE_866_length_6224_cov_151_763196_g467_i1_p1_GENE_NODE_866_length_6224_cov_151_763196_g467_i1NODE_866_length_6224_cov_151_763196_g467_i1_p1_ORF_typecomplete_len1064_score200_48RPN1_RPN2_N/PF17781_1/2e54RPN1_C/PF18051_1/7_8e19PC_rep/PF01851_22/3e03PC_rep/PF01851_22/59PC_rep/PF01851_22/91PC_rep/PF01851_22/41PC_rep/PF01851_22/8e02PC_rep/PF01851_22/9_6e08HEAT_2/PF13646_6/1_4e04HEAT_2/PF13646_6/7_1e02HEAT_2/PF13646_6/4_6e02HEAT_2/PF13646_6/0_014TPR_15/PF13429_6/1_9e03T
MASVPKPLKFLRPFLECLEDVYDAMKENDQFRVELADLLSLLATVRSTTVDLFSQETKKRESGKSKDVAKGKETSKARDKEIGKENKENKDKKDSAPEAPEGPKPYQRSVLEYRCAGSKATGIPEWGAEYVRCLTADLVAWYKKITAPLEPEGKVTNDEDNQMTDGPSASKAPAKQPEPTRPSLEHLVSLPLILDIGEKCCEYLWQKGAHLEGCDLLYELSRLSDLCKYPIDHIEASRLVEYLDAIGKLIPYSEKAIIYLVMFNLSLSHGDLITAMTIALEENDIEKISEVMRIAKSVKNKPDSSRQTAVVQSDSWAESARVTYDIEKMDEQRLAFEKNLRKCMRAQLCYLLARHTLNFPLDDMFESTGSEESEVEPEELAEIQSILRRDYLPSQFQYLIKELDVVAPRNPDDIFKAGWDDKKRRGPSNLDSHRAALAASYVSGFVHAGFNKDDLLTIDESSYVNRTTQSGITAATAAIGLIHMWDVEEGLTQIDKFQYSSDPHTRAGALLAFGVNSANSSNEADPVITLVGDAIRSTHVTERLAAYAALGYGYAGTARTDVSELLVPVVLDLEAAGGLEASATAALALGFTFVGTADEAVAEALLQTLLERAEQPEALTHHHAINFSLGLALLFLGRGPEAEVVLAGLDAIEHPVGKVARILIQACAYAASGEMAQVEELLRTCITASEEALKERPAETTSSQDEETTPPPAENPLQPVEAAAAVLCLPLITLREDIGGEMILRLFNHFLQFDNLFVRRAVPLALGFHAASNPKPAIVELLSKLSHDTDADTALHAIVALGLVGAGTNNARIAQLLRGLAHFYGADASASFLVRLSQGLLYSGKGLLSISPLHQDRRLYDKNALAGLLAFCVQAIFTKDTLCASRDHLNYYHLVLALHPRWLITLDESLQPVSVPVRIGQAVDTAGLAGQPRKITGFRTHTTPVLLAFDEKIQIGSEEWQPLTQVLEGIVIVRRLNQKEQSKAARSLE